jgi:hypothetical protein
MHGDSGIDQIASERPQPRKCPLLVGASQLAVSGYIRREDGCEFPGFRHSPHLALALCNDRRGACHGLSICPSAYQKTERLPRMPLLFQEQCSRIGIERVTDPQKPEVSLPPRLGAACDERARCY